MNYSSFDLMKKYNIKKGSWYSISKKLQLDDYCIIDENTNKRIYNDDALKILDDYFNSKQLKHILKNSNPETKDTNNNYLIVMQQNSMLLKNYEDIKLIASKFEELYLEERKKTEDNLVVVNDLKNVNINLQNANNDLKNVNNNLQNENNIRKS